MYITAEHDEGEDFGSVELRLAAEDWFRIQGEMETGITIRFSIWNHEADELIKAIQPIADASSLL